MTDQKKPSLLRRLFGAPEAVPIAPTPQLVEPEAIADEALPPAGPPETTIDYVEEVEAQAASEPEPVLPTPPSIVLEPSAPPPRQSWFQRLASGLKRSSDQLSDGITSVFTKKRLDSETLEDLSDLLIQADFGIETTDAITSALKKDRFDRSISTEDVRAVLANEVQKVLEPVAVPLVIDRAQKPFVILMIGVNGSGKTTTIGKLAAKFRADGLKVMLAAGDTFRAAAIEQLQIWGQRTGAEVVVKPAGSDASGLAFDAVTRARAEGLDVLIIDTAGRLQNRNILFRHCFAKFICKHVRRF